jgi:hypothetical protein
LWMELYVSLILRTSRQQFSEIGGYFPEWE